jgi:hypothetical protein
VKVPAARKAANTIEQRRYQRQYDRDRAPALRTMFPQVARVQLELSFRGAREAAPSAQTFVLYPAARAFFRYPCPCQDCDGEFDVTDAVRTMAAPDSTSTRSRTLEFHCQGARSRDRVSGSSCPMELSCRIVISRTAPIPTAPPTGEKP